MSLLMDALKRAETSKQEAARAAAAQGKPAPAADGLSLEPLPAPSGSAAGALPDLASHIDALDADLAATAPAPVRQPAPAPIEPTLAPNPDPQSAPQLQQNLEALNQAAARNAFAAKQADETPSKRPMWIALGVLGLAFAGIGVYVWVQMQSIGGGSLTPVPNAPVQTAPRPAPPTAAPSPPALPLTPPPATSILPPISASTAGAPPAEPRPATMPRQDIAPSLQPRPAPGSGVPIRFSRTRPEPDINVQEGYSKLQGNHLDAARRDYDKALASDPNNVDALLALAAIAQRQGHAGDADRYLQRAIEADPRSPAALAAALGSNAGGDQQANESRLKSLLTTQPESGPLNFALGNLYARQGRWSEAQQAYFNAVAADADNPDYLFNLAVSLDQLRQPKLAAQHYRLALEAAERRPAAFDRERVKLRLSELQP